MSEESVTDVDLIGVPFDGYGRAGNHARAAAALRAAGLVDAFGARRVVDDQHLELPAPTTGRGPHTTLLNEPALLAMTDSLNRRVREALAGGRFPFVYGGDCSTLLGIVTGLRDHGDGIGVVFIDGHEDTMPLDVSEDGEAANTEIGLLLGLTGRLLDGALGGRLPALAPELLTVLGPRDGSWRRRFNVGSLAECGVWLKALDDVLVDPASAARGALAHLARRTERWWLHVDLDVLDPECYAAQGLPGVADEPGGLTWEQLTTMVDTMIRRGGCVGASIAIYDPDQDPDGHDAQRIVDFVRLIARPS